MVLQQLDPPIPFLTAAGEKVTALLVLDYGVDYETLFLCGYDGSRELWWVRQSELRLVDNVTMGRLPKNWSELLKCSNEELRQRMEAQIRRNEEVMGREPKE